MKKNIFKTVFIAASVLFITSCEKDNETADSGPITNAEVITIINIEDVTGAADEILTDLFDAGDSASLAAKTTDECYVGAYTDTGYTLTFDSCDLGDGNVLGGTIAVTYVDGTDTTSFTATYTDFSVNGIVVNGTRAFEFNIGTDEISVAFDVTSNITVALENEDVITVTGTQTYGFDFGVSFENVTITLDGSWTVKINNDTYAVVVTDTLSGDAGCAYLTEGTMTLSKNGLEVIADYGDGTCDDVITITYPDGTTNNVNLDD